MRFDQAVNIADLRRMARRRLPKLVLDYIEGGAEDEMGLEENLQAFARLKLVPRFLTDCSSIDLGTTLFGKAYALPFGIGPTGVSGLFRPKGDLLLAEAALAEGVPYVMSGTSSAAIEDLSPAAAANAWYQLYTGCNHTIDEDIVRRAAGAGMRTLVITVDSEVRTKRERDIRNGFGAEPVKAALALEALLHPGWLLAYLRDGGMPAFRNFAPYAAVPGNTRSVRKYLLAHLPGNPVWSDVERYRRLWTGNLVVKGLMHPADAVRAVAAGADGIVVSNHGGRQLDRAPAAIDMLSSVIAAVGDRAVVMVDGGVRRGADVITALCLGARFVFLGRATLYGLVTGGMPGVRKAVAILRHEMETVGRHLGAARTADFDAAFLYPPASGQSVA